MATPIPQELYDTLHEQFCELITVKPHVAGTHLPLHLTGKEIALYLLSAKETTLCDEAFTEWAGKGFSTLDVQGRADFSAGMLDAARKDVANYFESIDGGVTRATLLKNADQCDITEDTAINVVVLILGNMMMHSLMLQHEKDQPNE